MKKNTNQESQGIALKISGRPFPIEHLSSRESICRQFSLELLKNAQTALVAERDILGNSCPVVTLLGIAKIELLIGELTGTKPLQ